MDNLYLKPETKGRIGKRYSGLCVAVLMCCVITGCISLPRNPVPIDEMPVAEIPNLKNIRVEGLYGQINQEHIQADLVNSWSSDKPDNYCAGPADQERMHCILVVSGGGGFGAFGAGILNGWTASGNRPNFKIVTGISTGSLIAPFAFLGPDYDEQVKDAFTTIKGGSDILIFRGLIKILFSESLADSKPLADIIAGFVDEEFLAKIAREHERGKRLFVGTTNMDSQRFVAWNMGAIATNASPQAMQLFRDVLLASASIPVAFPPVMIRVETPSGTYDEMHADGGTETQFFFPGDVFDLPAVVQKLEAKGDADRIIPGNFRVYVIRNARFTPEPEQVQRNIGKIAGRAVSTMIQAMGQSDLHCIFAVTQARGMDFNYVEVPPDFIWQSDDEFDQSEMNRLFDIGFAMASGGDFWDKKPLGTFASNLQRLDKGR
ncbi:MAG: patatin-like phospholipase family protein [Alphaproteobacteria bacterium]|nr:patatin-like phospholipase family protein [Alphaproteobacteria bacterium]